MKRKAFHCGMICRQKSLDGSIKCQKVYKPDVPNTVWFVWTTSELSQVKIPSSVDNVFWFTSFVIIQFYLYMLPLLFPVLNWLYLIYCSFIDFFCHFHHEFDVPIYHDFCHCYLKQINIVQRRCFEIRTCNIIFESMCILFVKNSVE